MLPHIMKMMPCINIVTPNITKMVPNIIKAMPHITMMMPNIIRVMPNISEYDKNGGNYVSVDSVDSHFADNVNRNVFYQF